MSKKWAYFIGAAVLAAYLLVSNGAPPVAVAAGIAGSAIFMRRKSRTLI